MHCEAITNTCAKTLVRRTNPVRIGRKSLLLLSGTLLYLAGSSQSFVGYGFDNYSGVNSLLLNPGMLADSRYKVNVNIFSASAIVNNNAYEIDSKKLLGLHFSNLTSGNGYYNAPNTDYKSASLNADILGPSAMINLDSRNGLGLITRSRIIGNEYNLSNGLFQLLGSNPNTSFYNTDIINRSLQTKMAAFDEIGLSYGRVLVKKPNSEFKIGITAKYIAGMGYASVSSGQMLANLAPNNNINSLNADISTRYTPSLDDLGSGNFSSAFNKPSGNGWGLDLGFIYEWKPAGSSGGDGSTDQKGWLARDPVPYALRLGLSITDLGSVKYKNSPNGQDYAMNADGHNASELQMQGGETYGEYLTRLKTNGLIVEEGGPSSMQVSLPTAVHVNADWHVYKRIFVDGDVLINMVSNTNLLSPNYITSFTLTPRLEKKWFSIYSPVSYNAQGQLTWGAGFRMGPVFAGSGMVISSLLKNRMQSADVHVGMTIPIFQHDRSKDRRTDTLYKQILITHDRDGDGVVDEKDACPDSAGPVALLGCPDRDGDGVPNYKDKCPDVKGSPNFQGCPAPDTDGDGVNDDDDKCPLVKGLASNHGCPPIRPEVIQSVNNAAQRVFFVRAKAIIEKDSYSELDRVVTIILADTTLHLHIEGHTDNEGTDQRNLSLSTRRAKAVLHYLEAHGIPAARMDYKGYGSTRPLTSNDTPEGMARNRRVEMILTNW
jgi:outer membrane protein OmpA-like peptidoglycan-associated protein